MRVNKKALGCFIVAVALGLALIVAGIVMFSRTPRNRVIASDEGTTVTRIASSYENDCWYYGDSAGKLVKLDEDGNVAAQTVISEGRGIRTLSSGSHFDYLLVLDEDYRLFRVYDRGEIFETELLKESYNYLAMTADDEYLYFAVPASRYTQFVKFAKDDLTGDPVAAGLMYSCYRQGTNYSFQPLIASLIGLYADENYLYAITSEGQYHRMSKDFSLNSFTFMSEEEKEALGVSIASNGTVTISGDSYDAEKYRTVRKQLAAKSSAFDEENGRFYIAGADGEFAALDTSFSEIEGFSATLPSTPASGALTFHSASETVYVGYQNISSVTVIDVSGEGASVQYEASVAFYITNMTVPGDGNRLIVICSGNDRNNPDFKELYSADIHTLALKGTMKTVGVVCIVLAVAAAAVAVFAGLTAFKRGFGIRLARTTGDMKRNWITYLIIFGSLAMLIAFCYYPGISSMILSFFDYTQANPTMRFNNFENFIDIFTNSSSLLAFKNMLIFLFADILIALIPPVIFAMCLIFMRNKSYGTFARIVLFLPSVLPGIATLLIWTRGIYGVDGVLNLIYKTFAGKDASSILFLQDHGIASLIFMGFPFVGSYLIFYGALMNVPPSFYEAAELDGCPLLKRIFMIDLPMISPQIKYVFILAFIQSVQNFGRVLMTTDGAFGTQIPIVLMYKSLQTGNYGMSSAYATLMFLVLIAATILNLKIKTAEGGEM